MNREETAIHEVAKWCPCGIELVSGICPGCGLKLGEICMRTHVCIPRSRSP